MKHLLLLLVALIALPMTSTAKTTNITEKKTDAEADSSFAVIAYFNKGESYNYDIIESEWKIKKGDTVAIVYATTKGTLTVVDSTKNGYDMEWIYTGVEVDSTINNFQMTFLKNVLDKTKQLYIGQPLRFKISPEGEITKWDNLKDVQKKAKSMMTTIAKELEKMPEIDSMKAIGIDVASMIKGIDKKIASESFTEDIENLFACHGKEYTISDKISHTPADKDNYESATRTAFLIDSNENELYRIYIETVTTVPNKDVKDLVTSVVGAFTNGQVLQSDEEKKAMDEQLTEDLKIESVYSATFFPDGWPLSVTTQDSRMIANQGKVKQTCIIMTE